MADDQDEGGWQIKTQKREKHVDVDPLENGYEEEPDFSDPEGFIDDVSEDELLGDLLKKRPKETDGIDSVIVVDNVPAVGPERLEKLQNVIRKIFQKFGKIQNEFYPQENGKTKGYIFLEYSNPSSATEAVKMANGYKLDKQHTFIVNLFSDFDKFADVPDEWEPPKPQPYEDPGNLHSWLSNEDCYDQYSVIYDGGDTTAILLNQQNGEPVLAKERARWTETYVRWSPQGTYLATLHAKGIALWGAEDFKQIMRYSHTGVQLIDFSPCEKYLVTFSPLPDSKDDPQAIIIWDLRTGQKKRGFHCENASVWPIFKWNHDGAYFARMTPDTLSIYETPSMGLLDKKSIRVVGLKDFGWSPSDNVIAYWTPEDQNVPARVTLIGLPNRRELCAKNLFSVADCKIHWQKSGDYLCVKVDRYAKKKEEKDNQVKYSGIYHNFNLFRMREKQIPVDTIEIKETIVAFAWEPTGHRFAFLMGESPRISVCAYNIKRGGNVELIKTLEKRQANHLFWCPNGQFMVVGGLRSMNGVLEFIDTSDMTVMAQAEHFMATDVEWDPTGRYVATGVSWWGHKVDNAYWIWNFQGKLLHKQPMERFCQLLWRPRPPTLLSNDQIKEIKKNLKSVYTPRFEMKDRMSQSKASKELIEKRHSMMEEFKLWRQEAVDEFYDNKERRLELRDGIDTDELESHIENFTEETIEFLVKVEETVIEE